jgi:hypothetical protein
MKETVIGRLRRGVVIAGIPIIRSGGTDFFNENRSIGNEL